MNTRILSTSLFCVALLGSSLPAAATIRPEIAQALQDARRIDGGMGHFNTFVAMKKIKAAEAVPNQTAEEKQAVARVKAYVAGNSAGLNGDPNFGTPP